MKANSRLALALHALGHLAAAPDEPRTSAQIARHNRTNPVVVRRVLGLLRDAGIVTSRKGHAGGWQLARAAKAISLADVYGALGETFIAPVEASQNYHACGIEAELHSRVGDALRDAEARLLERLAQDSVQDLAAH
jgi:Rrf2 family protein